MRRSTVKRAGVALCAALALTAAVAAIAVRAAPEPSPSGDAARGRALFTGAAPLQARLASHPSDLPAAVVRCANCHAAGGGAAVANSIAPRLSRGWLVDWQSRRGGPPSRYDRDAFCALLRDGVDPSYVLINVQMPRYHVDARDCAALWHFLTEGSDGRS
ncbi:hypothetical protein [Burkholderia sp. FERM BP-3421]|uniref:hypothetical protein n=1 Tax=Burkholderia sp. FERM BP-3421 TaxID=1494466 RepID=UPI0030823B86